MTVESIRELLQNNKVRWTTHCVEQMGERDISKADVTHCIENGEITEDYPYVIKFEDDLKTRRD